MSREGRGNVRLDGTSYGAFKLINDSLGDLMLGGSICSKERKTHFASTIFYFTLPVKLIVKQPETYNSLEILLFPFDYFTWIIILVLFVGREISKIALKNSSLGFGNFSLKVRLLAWLFGFFILRSSYEGSIFRFLHNRPKRPVPNDFREAIRNGYSFISDTRLNYFLKDFTELDDKLKLYDVPSSEIFEEFYQLNDSKVGLISRGESYKGNHLNLSMFRGFSVVKKPVVHNFLCMYMPKFSFLTVELNKRIEDMVNYGFVKRILEKSTKFSWFYQGRAKEANIMTVNHLSGAFQLLIGLLALAICIFVMEILSV
ncbi:uncharacterized protein LOC129909717 [Episyrphus balteatus]|uniref:uncharacterized protein LOC129909717 n=1 Tax=Episyrphus balteatus TaxID=286459 RepID=UPI002485AC99|nr:uncharacterized protein LOC129909717 [Episyrphus balteatus]